MPRPANKQSALPSRFNDALSDYRNHFDKTRRRRTRRRGIVDARSDAAPIKFAGTGEKLDQFELFVPERLAGRILGMGDVVGLVEKAAEAVDEEEAARLERKLRTASFDFNDFLAQFKMMRRMGPAGEYSWHVARHE